MATSINTVINIPDCYEELANILKEKISNYGEDLIKDCKSSCNEYNKNLVNCWNMFQAACIAYANELYKKAKLLISYIVNTLKLNINVETKEPQIIKKYNVTIDKQILNGTDAIVTENGQFTLSDISYKKGYTNINRYYQDVDFKISGIYDIIDDRGTKVITNIQSNIFISANYQKCQDLTIINNEINIYDNFVFSSQDNLKILSNSISIKCDRIDNMSLEVNMQNDNEIYFVTVYEYYYDIFNQYRDNVSINYIYVDDDNIKYIDIKKAIDFNEDLTLLKTINTRVVIPTYITTDFNELPKAIEGEYAYVESTEELYIGVNKGNVIWLNYKDFQYEQN